MSTKSMTHIHDFLKLLDQDVRIWDVSHTAQDRPYTQRQQEDWARELMLNHEAEIRTYFRKDDFLSLAFADTSDELFLFGHPCRPHLKVFLATFKPRCTQQVDIGPLDQVYEKLKQGQGQDKYQATLTPSSDPHPEIIG